MTKSNLPEPKFILDYSSLEVSDYRPVMIESTGCAIFERRVTGSSDAQLYQHDLGDRSGLGTVFLEGFDVPQTRPDWSPSDHSSRMVGDRNGHSAGTVVFNGKDSIYYVAAEGGANEPCLIPYTSGMLYPTWYPDGNHLAVMNNSTKSLHPVTSKINLLGDIVDLDLGNGCVYMGMPTVNPQRPQEIAFAGQSTQLPGGYNQGKNYIWIADALESGNLLRTLDHCADPITFEPYFQGRAPWYSPDGNWIAFESNQLCPHADRGDGYAVYIQQCSGDRPAKQITDPKWGAQHAKWVDNETLIVTCYQQKHLEECSKNTKRGIATLDVSNFVNN